MLIILLQSIFFSHSFFSPEVTPISEMYTIPQVEIQSDALQVLIDEREHPNDESIWLRYNDELFDLKATGKSFVNTKSNILITQSSNKSTSFQMMRFNDKFSLVFPNNYHGLKITENYNFTSIATCNDNILIGTDDGSVIKLPIPISIHPLFPIISQNIHFADIIKILRFPSNKVFLTVGLDLQIKLWSNENKDSVLKTPVRILKNEHCRRITDVGMIGRGRNIVSCGLDGKIIIWEMSSALSVWKASRIKDLNDGCTSLDIIQSENYVQSNKSNCFFDCEGKFIIVGHQSGFVTIWDCSTRLFMFEHKVSNFAISDIKCVDQGRIIIGLNNGHVLLYQIDLKVRTLELIWDTHVEVSDNLIVDIIHTEVYKGSVIVLSDNKLVRLNLKDGKLSDVYVGIDEKIFHFTILNGTLIVVGKRNLIVSINL